MRPNMGVFEAAEQSRMIFEEKRKYFNFNENYKATDPRRQGQLAIYHVNTRNCPMIFSKVSFFLSRAFLQKHAHSRTAEKMASCLQPLHRTGRGAPSRLLIRLRVWGPGKDRCGCILAPGQSSPAARKSVHEGAYHEVVTNQMYGRKPHPRFSGQAPTVTRPGTGPRSDCGCEYRSNSPAAAFQNASETLAAYPVLQHSSDRTKTPLGLILAHRKTRGERERSPPLPQIMQSSFPHLGKSQGSAHPKCDE